jgi:asparagine synthase (glutamine-hydrolysing)
MCGIAGFQGEFDELLLGRMGQRDGAPRPRRPRHLVDVRAPRRVRHRRLSIIDLSPRGHQPMWDATRRVVTVYNGELYNYRELRDELIADGFRSRATATPRCC